MGTQHAQRMPILLLGVLALAMLATAHLTQSTSSGNELTDSRITCTKPKPFKLRPSFGDCVKAINMLSGDRRHNEFHPEGTPDLWSLPVTENYGNCDVFVDLGWNRERDSSSWWDVRNAAVRVATHCWNSIGGSLGPTGGTIQIGDRERIWVRVLRKGSSDQYSNSVGNLTVTMDHGTDVLVASDWDSVE